MTISSKLFKRYYPDTSKDGTLFFYNWLRSYIQSVFVILNVGAGSTSHRKIRSLKGEVQKVLGADIDKEVLNNEDLDEAFVIKNGKLPFRDNTFDLVWADYVFEHVQKPGTFLKEVYRVLKPGSSFFFRTPNKYHYVSIFARVTPHQFHRLMANRVRGLGNDTHEPYPTYHRLNSRKEITDHAESAGFRKSELRLIEAEPSYLMFHSVPFVIGVLYERVVNRFNSLSGIRANIFGRLEK